MKINLEGKNALITGATGELGRTMVRTLAECGANPIIHYISKTEMAAELTEEVNKMGRKAMAVQSDITSLASVMTMRNLLIQEKMMPDIVVANAVSSYNWSTILEQPAEDFQSQFNSCVLQSVFLSKAFIPSMIEKKSGRYIAINTECAILADPATAAYVAAKKGLDGLMRVLAKEVGEYQVTVNQIAPGWTISDRDRQGEAREDQLPYLTRVPMKRRGTDQEIANVVAFLASDLASFIHGAFIPVNGGLALPGI